MLQNCARIEQSPGTNIFNVFDQGRELFSLALTDLENFKRVLAVLGGAFETDVLAARCESAQGRYKRGLPVLRGATNSAGPSTLAASGPSATFFEGINLDGKTLEQKLDRPDFQNYAPANRRNEWSCRYEGDIYIPVSGGWTLAASPMTACGSSLMANPSCPPRPGARTPPRSIRPIWSFTPAGIRL